MRNIFDQYSQPENRLTHSLASVLHQDRALLKSFLNEFGPADSPRVDDLVVIEQSLPGKLEQTEDEQEKRGLPDALIYSEFGWVLAIESKLQDRLTADQLKRHQRTLVRSGFDRISGLAITIQDAHRQLDGWHMTSWREVYRWANSQKAVSHWARILVDYFNTAEAKMASDGYLKEGTITEFSGISFDPYTYLEGKRVLRLLMEKLRSNQAFIKMMRLDPASGRASITNQERLWDFISFVQPGSRDLQFQQYPHCTIGLSSDIAEAVITFPNGMNANLLKRLYGDSYATFEARLESSSQLLRQKMKGLTGYRPIVRVLQRRYPSQRSIPLIDGLVELDLRTALGDEAPIFGPKIKKQPEWARAAYDLLLNKRSNIQFQIGVEFYLDKAEELAHSDADQYFISAFEAFRPFAAPVID